MNYSMIATWLTPIAFSVYILIVFYNGKKIEKISKNLSEDKKKALRNELKSNRDYASWMATIRLPKPVGVIGNILAFIIILFIITIVVVLFTHKYNI
ncbi:MAG: hypothetical protein KDI52_06975 [Xanthomonadales bacterium]|nr:hypothetical protein [Xanthomonadales bacterium]